MKNKYIDIISQTFDFPQEDFKVEKGKLFFNDIPLMDIIKEFGTPLKLTYVNKVGEKIREGRKLFEDAFYNNHYKGNYYYCYCTKSSHFSFVLDEVLENGAHIETSSAYDLEIINNLYKKKKLSKNLYIICNGFKLDRYKKGIADLIDNGFRNTIPILDNQNEFDYYAKHIKSKFKVGIRIAADEKPNFDFYTSRLGNSHNTILEFYRHKIKPNPNIELKMLHFFINSGVQDTAYYWNELRRCIGVYCELKKECPELIALNIGGGFPFKNSLSFNYDYKYMSEEIVFQIKNICEQHGVHEPDIFTEYGSYTVSESAAIIYSVVDQKRQNEKELWSLIDSSFLTTVPDTWALNQKFILLAVNNWEDEYEKVNLGGITCDSMDYYSSERHMNQVFMPKYKKNKPLYIGLFHTGAYQESIGGYGGLQHCLIPAPSHVIVKKDGQGQFSYTLFSPQQEAAGMLKLLGY